MENLAIFSYFVYIKTTDRIFNINDIKKDKLDILLKAYEHGKKSFMITGKKYWIDNLLEIHIYEIDIYKHPLADILCHKETSYFGEDYVDLEYFSTIGKEVTDDFITGEFGEVTNEEKIEEKKNVCNSNNVFIVHGHDNDMKNEVARFIEKDLQLNSIILNEQPNKGKTVIEKFEEFSEDVAYAIVLLSPDDETEEGFRARQNVIFELGYFIGRLGRNRVCALKKGDVAIPSDITGILYILFDGNWKYDLQKEIRSSNE